ncbi:hypothetical protein S245_026347, partial [Arachis hypogaea]
VLHEVDKQVARWLLDCRIPFNAVMSPFFQDMLDGVAHIGPGYKGATCFATVFITLKSIFERKSDLPAMVVDTHFTKHKLGRSANNRAVSAIILDNKFWDDCFTAYKIVSPLIKLPRLVDADDKPSLGIVYEDSVEAMKEIHLYRDQKESFDRPEAFRAAKKLQHDECWRLFGGSAPCLQNMVVRILSQASASSGKERKKRKQKVQYDPIDIESIDMVDFWVTEEVVEKEPDLSSNIEDLL